MSSTTITDEETGKDVVDQHGEKIGIISGVRGGTAYVDPDPGVVDRFKTMMEMEDVDEDDYPLDSTLVGDITDEEVRLQRAM